MIPAIAYYTEGTPYEREARILKDSLDALEIRHFIEGVEDRGSWQKNTQLKAEFIAGWLHKHSEIPHVFYIDVDAFVLKSPLLFYDLAAEGWDIGASIFPGGELLSGTLFLSNNDPTREVIARWMEINAEFPDVLPDRRKAWDQRTLHMAIRENDELRFYELPCEYAYIIALSQQKFPDRDPVIVHTRGAARLKERR